VRSEPQLSGDALAEMLATYEPSVLVVRSTRVDAAHLTAGPALELVVRAGAGINTIDVGTASTRGIYVANCPGKNATAVAELTIGLLLALDRRIPDNVADLRAGQWNKGKYARADGLKGRVLGVIGLGGIGREVARLGIALGMRVQAWSRSLDEATAGALGVRRCATPEEVARGAHALTVHLALTADTRGLIGDSILRELREGALFINTSRSAVVDEQALLVALDRQRLRVGLDVFSDEPSAKEGPFTHALAAHPGVYGTHHIGASTAQAQDAVAAEACRVIERYKTSGSVPNCVNMAEDGRARAMLIVRHLDRVGVLAAVLGHLRSAHVNVKEMENRIFAGHEAAVARLQLSDGVDAQTLDRIRETEHVLSATVVMS
jgi:D-3-phosphoglycerate dehydrogenase